MEYNWIIKGDLLDCGPDHTLRIRENRYLVCRSGRCAGVFDQVPEAYKDYPLRDCTGKIVIPGLVDLHVHAPQYVFRGLGMDLELLDWLETYTFPEEARYADESYAACAYTQFVEALRASGTTRACIFATAHTAPTLFLMEQLEKSGLHTMVGRVNMDRNCPPALCEPSAEQSLRETESWLRQSAHFQHTKPILTPRFTPTSSDAQLAGLGALAKRENLPVQSHLSENEGEIAWVRELCPEAIDYADSYDRFGLMTARTVMAHCVSCTPRERALLAARGVFAAHCPQSNANLASGIAPVRALLEQGVRVGLGTDVAGGAHLSVFRAMTDAVAMSKLYWRLVDRICAPLSFAEAFALATRGGGAFFGEVGAFETGWALDALVLSDEGLPAPRTLTLEERLKRIVYELEDRAVCGKYVEGRCLF